MNPDKYFRTQKFNLSTFLYTKNQVIVGVNTLAPKLKEFAFLRSEALEELIEVYKFGDKNDPRLLVPIRTYEQARDELLDMLKD